MAHGPLLSLVERFGASHPGIKIDVVCDCGVAGLLNGTADIAWFGFEPPPESGLAVRPAGINVTFLMASETYLKRYGAPSSPDDLAGRTVFIRNHKNGAYNYRLEHGMTVVELPDGVLCREESAQICRDRLLAGEGIAVDLSTGFMADALLDGRVVTVLCGYAADQSGISSW